jgi:hypothetical protein
MKRSLIALALILALAVPVVASGKVVSLGDGDPYLPTSQCPDDPCLAAYRMTGYQERSEGKTSTPYYVRRDGKIVAFTVKLGKLTQIQIDAFNSRIGSPASVRLTVVRRGTKKARRNDHRVLAQSDVIEVNDYFGSSPTFVLDEPLKVERGNIVALTVPTWAPVLAQVPTTDKALWRSSRPKGGCLTTPTKLAPDSAKERVGRLSTWGCNYENERLLYTATYVPENRTTKPAADAPAAARASQLGSLELR